MGGWGSGRNEYATTPTVGESCQLDADDLTKGIDHPGNAYGTREWEPRHYPSVELTVHFEGSEDADRATHLRLEYTVEPIRGDAFEEEHPVALEYTECNFGGVRPWLRCPGVVDGEECGRRCRKLYLPNGGRYWLCRECYNLGYLTSRRSGDDLKQAELRYKRAFEKADAENRRPHPNNMPYTPDRPKGMHHTTFEELEREVWIADMVWTEEMRKKTNELLNHLDADRRILSPEEVSW